MLSKQFDGDVIVRITKAMILGFVSLSVIGAYLVHPVLLVVTLFIFVVASA